MRRWWLPYAVLLVVALGLGGCGVSATDRPVDVGDAAAGGTGNVDTALEPPGPDRARTAGDLVRDFLLASAGGLDANERVKRYLTRAAFEGWQDPINVENPPLSVVRIVSGPSTLVADPERGTPVTVQYQPVGTLTDRGRVDELTDLVTQPLTFWVVQEDFNLRIGEIEGWPAGQLLLSDQALTEFYRIQPIYFWDTGYTTLVPDLRYVPRTINSFSQANLQLDWLTGGPSPWLAGVQALPSGTTAEDVLPTEDGAMRVGLSAAAVAPGDPEALRRLMAQLQWSLSDDGETASSIDLYIDNQQVPADANENAFRSFRYTLSYQGQERRYDIVEGVVQPLPPTPATAVLAGSENASVVTAAIRRDEPEAAALVQEDGFGRRTLHIVSGGQSRQVDLSLPLNSSLGRPSFVPLTDLLLVPTGGPNGRLVAVSVESGATTDASGSRLPGVTAAVVSPDGRRVAVIAGGQLYVAPLILTNNTVMVGSTTRQLLAGQLTASAVTWTSDSWLLVAGTRDDVQPALWRVTADGVVARDLSGSMGTLRVDDLVCWPNWRNIQDGATAVRAVTDLGVYTFISQFDPEPNLTAPFFG